MPVNALSAMSCGADLDGDGFADAPGETATCYSAPLWEEDASQWFCPIEPTDCQRDFAEPVIEKRCPLAGFSYVESRNRCEASATSGCGQERYDPALNVCFASATEIPTCPSGTYDEDSGKCDLQTYSCPLGEYSCFDTGGAIPQCSPNPCIDVANPVNDISLLPGKEPMLVNDGPVDGNGNCLGEIYIFSGKATRCRPPGVSVGYANDCCDSSEPALMDSTTGNRINNVASAISTVYEMAQVGYYSYQIATGAMTAVEFGGQVVVYNVANGTIAASYASGTATASGVIAAQGTATASAATTTGTVTSGLSSYAGALFNPTTIAIAVVVMVVMKVMMGNGCSQEDIETAMLVDSDYCHYLGTVCERRWRFVGCVQRAKRFCCFNSKMARIVHEQGRPQLKAFGPGGGWGTAKNPNCRGFTPQEFQQLDFSRIDLSEYFGDIQRDLTQKIQGAQSTVQQKIQEHYEQIR
jgi:conjugal transfer mating pair stabilization protein TraN